MADANEGTQVATSVIQVRIALLGLLFSIVSSSFFPLIAALLTVTVFAVYTNGATDNTEFSGEVA